MEHICRIMIVDDEILTRQGLKHLVNWEREGFRIVGEASNGREALERMETLRPHIVLTDIVMPVMDGEEFTRIAKQRYPELEIIVLSSFGEFNYVRSTFQSGVADYILKPKLAAEELLAIMKEAARRIPTLVLQEAAEEYKMPLAQLIEHLIAGYIPEYDEAAIANEMPYAAYCLLGADLRWLPYRDSSIEAIQSMLQNELDAALEKAAYAAVPTDTGSLVWLVNAEPQELRRLSNIMRSLAAWAQEESLDILWMAGEIFLKLEQLGERYRESFVKLSNYRFYFPHRTMLTWDELPTITDAEPQFDMSRFTDEMNRQHFDEAFQYVMKHVRLMAGHYRTDVFEYKSFLGNIIFNVTILVGNFGYDTKVLEEEKYAFFKKIDDAKHAKETLDLLEAFLAEVRQLLSSKPEPANPNMKMLLDYIHEHYAEPLSLSGLAQHFHFNASYLSSYFTAHNKEGFSEYLNKVRVEKAAELLRMKHSSISEIGSQVGYADHSYFTKVFKKLIGISPSLYRKQFGTKEREWL